MAKNTFNSIRIENEEHGSRMEKKLCKQMQCSELMSRVNGFCRKFSPVTLVCARERTQQKKIVYWKRKSHTHTRSDAGKREKERWALTLQYKVCQFPIQPMQCHNWMKWMCIWCRRHKHENYLMPFISTPILNNSPFQLNLRFQFHYISLAHSLSVTCNTHEYIYFWDHF